MKKLLLFLMLAALGNTFAQTNELKFTKQEIFNDYKIVYFALDKPMNKTDFRKILFDIKNSKNHFELSLESTKTCKAKINLNTTPNDILIYLKKYGYDFAYEVIVNTRLNHQEQEQKQTLTLPAHYPKKNNTGNTKQDEKDYLDAISVWRKTYPNEWKEYKKNNKNTIK